MTEPKSPPKKQAPRKQAPKKECRACADPEHYVRHTCGLKELQDMLRF